MIIFIGIFTFYVHCAVSLNFVFLSYYNFMLVMSILNILVANREILVKALFHHLGFVDHIASGMWTTLLVGSW